MARNKEAARLSNSIVDNGMYEKLKLRNSQLDSLLESVNTRFLKIKTSYTKNQATLFFMNGRVSKRAFDLATQMLEEAEKELLKLYSEMQYLKDFRDNINDVLKSIENSKKSEDKILKLEQFMNRQSNTGFAAEHLPLFEDFKNIQKQARLLEHSASALLQLKAGQ